MSNGNGSGPEPPPHYNGCSRCKQAYGRYAAALHGMQSGVAVQMGGDGAGTSPKCLRVGVNSAMVEHAALVELLVKDQVIDQCEYAEALAEAMERERCRYERSLGVKLI